MKALKIAVSAILALLILFFLTFAVGEVAGGDISGLQHLLQAAPFILVIVLIWWKPLRRKKVD